MVSGNEVVYSDFSNIFFDFLANRLSVGNIISGLTNNQYFEDILAKKTEILFLA